MPATAVERRENVPVSETRLTVLTWAIGLLCSGFMATVIGAVPWAMSMQSEVSAIRAKLDNYQPDVPAHVERQLQSLESRVRELERRP